MAIINIEKKQFEPHPEGQHEGVVLAFEDLGDQEVTFNGKTEIKHKGELRIQSFDHILADGEAAIVIERVNFSGSKKSKLRKFRESILGRRLEGDEPWAIDTAELVGIGVDYVVIHNITDAGVYANLDGIWRSKDQTRARNWVEAQEVGGFAS